MITVLTGDNDFESRHALKVLEASFSGTPEYIDGAAVTLSGLPDILMGLSLFAEERLVIIDQLSASSAVWTKLPDWLPRISDTIHLVLKEPTLDKRTVTYKALKAVADIQTFTAWTSRDAVKAETWLVHYAREQGVDISRQAAKHLVARVGFDQWGLSAAVEMLHLSEADQVTESLIDAVIVPSAEENAFSLMEDALNGKTEAVVRSLRSLELSEEPHRLMALILSQAFSLLAAVIAPSAADPAKDFGIHPFVLSKLRRFSSSIGSGGALRVVELCAQADVDLKSSRADPWVLVERLLVKISHTV